MKVKGILITAFSCIIIGVCIFLLTGCKTTLGEKPTLYTESISQAEVFEIKASYGEVVLVKTEEEPSVSYYGEATINSTSNLLEINRTRKWYEYLSKWNELSYPKITVYINNSIKDLTITTNVGSIKIDDFSFEKVNLTTDVGSISLSNISLNEVNSKTDVGSIEVNNVIARDVKLEANVGSINVANCELNNVYLKTNTGSVNVTDLTVDSLKARLDTGSFNGVIVGDEADYSLSLINELNKENKSQVGKTEKNININVSCGGLNLRFK